MKTVNIYDAKTQFSKLVQMVQEGERIVIAKAGVPVADLTPHRETKPRVAFDVAKQDFKHPISDDQLMGDDPDIQKMFYGDR